MTRTLALVLRIIRQLLRDRRTLALLLLAPLLVLTLMHFIFDADEVPMRLGVNGVAPALEQALSKAGFDVIQASESSLRTDQLDGLLQLDRFLTVENRDPLLAKQLITKVNQVIANLGNTSVPTHSVEVSYLYGSAQSTFFDTLSPALIGYFVFFFVFLIAGIGLLRERTTGTLERLMSTPIRRAEVLAGYLLGYGLFAVIQTILVVIYATYVLDIQLQGSMALVIITSVLTAFVALSLGILLSTFAKTEFQMIQFIPLVIVPQIFFAGIFKLDGTAEWVQQLGVIMPISYSSDALRMIMYRGLGFTDVIYDMVVLLGFTAVFITLNMIVLRKYRN